MTKPDTLRPLVRWSVADIKVSKADMATYANTTWPVLLLRKDEAEPVQRLEPALRATPKEYATGDSRFSFCSPNAAIAGGSAGAARGGASAAAPHG